MHIQIAVAILGRRNPNEKHRLSQLGSLDVEYESSQIVLTLKRVHPSLRQTMGSLGVTNS